MKPGLLLATILWLTCAIANAQPVGRVLVAVGDVTVQRAGRDIPLTTGSEVLSGDTVKVGDISNAQIGFSDASIVALRSKSVFRVDEYSFDGNSESLVSKAVFSLLKGKAKRAITK